jgi:hypothetical protein
MGGGRVEEQDARSTPNQPAAIQSPHASIVHGFYGGGKMRIFGLELLDLDGRLQRSGQQGARATENAGR